MRFLFVYETAAGKVRDLLAELLVQDVHVIVARRGELSPRSADQALLEQHSGAEAAACELNRKYRKNVQGFVTFTVEPRKFRAEDRQLRDWLTRRDPAEESPRTWPAPETAFLDAATSPSLCLLSGALDTANRLDESRWAFAAKSADLLRNHADGGSDLGPFREWQANHGVAFAANGRVEYRYRASTRTDRYNRPSQWHLKAGDRTSPELAARIYFTVAELDGKSIVLVAHVGPHPSDGSYSADFGEIDLAT
jgi:hypothetical protein